MNGRQIIQSWPPNIQEIRQYLNPPLQAVFPFDGKLYNPSGQEIYQDIAYHEEVHFEQQKDFGNSELWWTKYLTDKTYRLQCEEEAYGKQYLWLKERVSAKDLKLALDEMSEALSRDYGLGLTRYQCERLIRKYG